jgi:hypothetical protein
VGIFGFCDVAMGSSRTGEAGATDAVADVEGLVVAEGVGVGVGVGSTTADPAPSPAGGAGGTGGAGIEIHLANNSTFALAEKLPDPAA